MDELHKYFRVMQRRLDHPLRDLEDIRTYKVVAYKLVGDRGWGQQSGGGAKWMDINARFSKQVENEPICKAHRMIKDEITIQAAENTTFP